MTEGPQKIEHELHIRRQGLLFSYTGGLMENVSIRLGRGEEWCPTEGLILNEDEGFPFREKLQPELRFQFDPEDVKKQLSRTLKDLSLHVTIEDLALAKRTTVSSHRLDDIVGGEKTIKIDLSSFKDLYFTRGFEIICFIHPFKDAKERKEAWSKSHILVRKVFTASSKQDGNTFNITWRDFDDDEDKKNVFYYIDWLKSEVSEFSGVEAFCVNANNNLRSQFKRLESNSHFGHLPLRQMASDIIYNIILTTMEFSDLDREPQIGSLHEQMWTLLQALGVDFNEFAGHYQVAEGLDKREWEVKVKKIAQQFYGVGEELRDLKFGGYRPIS